MSCLNVAKKLFKTPMNTGKILKFPEMNSANIYISEMFRKKSIKLF